MRTILAMVMLLAFGTAVHSFEIHVRDDDLGVVHSVDKIVVEKTIDWNDGPRQWATEFDGTHYGQLLAGMEMECIDASQNPSQWVDGVLSDNGKLTGSPTLPFEIVPGINRGHVYLYKSTSRNRKLVALSRFGCGDWGDSPISLFLDDPVLAISLTVAFNTTARRGRNLPCSVGERWHIELWGINATKIMHQDIVSIDPVDECILTVSFVSDVPIKAISTWVQNGPGVYWWLVGFGSIDFVPLTLEERVERLEGFHEGTIN